jgi:hypothetical protein
MESGEFEPKPKSNENTHAANFDDFADTFLEIDYKESRLDGIATAYLCLF